MRHSNINSGQKRDLGKETIFKESDYWPIQQYTPIVTYGNTEPDASGDIGLKMTEIRGKEPSKLKKTHTQRKCQELQEKREGEV